MDRKLTLDELRMLILNPRTPRDAIAPYVQADVLLSIGNAPGLRPDPETVHLTALEADRSGGATFRDWFNRLFARRRQEICRWRRQSGSTLPLLVAEGDSWFQFPVFLDDIIDNLGADGRINSDGTLPNPAGKYDIWCLSAAGDTLENMIEEKEYSEALQKYEDCKILLFSGAGNDFVAEAPSGKSIVYQVVKKYNDGISDPIYYLDTKAYRERLAFIEKYYKELLADLLATHPHVTVILHGYDHAIPHGGEGDPRHPMWAKKNEWLGEPLSQRGFPQAAISTVGREIVRKMIDDLNETQIRLCRQFPNAVHVDLRGTLTHVSQWADELHPNQEGFKLVAAKIAPHIQAALNRVTAPRMPVLA